jgi:hypothetical protein
MGGVVGALVGWTGAAAGAAPVDVLPVDRVVALVGAGGAAVGGAGGGAVGGAGGGAVGGAGGAVAGAAVGGAVGTAVGMGPIVGASTGFIDSVVR